MGVSRLINVSDALRPGVDLALVRFAYLFPECDADTGNDGILLSAPDEGRLREAARQLHYLLYREKISRDAQPLRERVFRRLFG